MEEYEFELKPRKGWRNHADWMLHYPCFVVLVLAQVARRRWVERMGAGVDGGT